MPQWRWTPQPQRRLSHMAAQPDGQLAARDAPPLTSGPLSSPPGQQVSPVVNNSPLQGGSAVDIGVSGSTPAAHTRTSADDLGVSGTDAAARKRTSAD